jgi:hypothetical protein
VYFQVPATETPSRLLKMCGIDSNSIVDAVTKLVGEEDERKPEPEVKIEIKEEIKQEVKYEVKLEEYSTF